MDDVAGVVGDLERGTVVRITEPDVGEVEVLLPGPRESRRIEPGVAHFVFAHPSGRMIGLDWRPPDGTPDWDACTLVGDEDGFHHALLVRESGGVRLLTRRQPGEPDDWEDRGAVTDVEIVDRPSGQSDP